MAINWVEVFVIATPALLTGGVAVSIVEGLFRRPEKRANVTTIYTQANIELLQQYRQDNANLREGMARLERRLIKRNRLIRLLMRTIDNAVPLVRKVSPSEAQGMIEITDQARQSLTGESK